MANFSGHVREITQKLQSILTQEQEAGYQDNVVMGKLEPTLNTLGKPFAALKMVLTGYTAATPAARQEKILAALAILERMQQRHAAPEVTSPQSEAIPLVLSDNKSADKTADKASDKPLPPLQPHALSEVLELPLASERVDLGANAAKKLATIGISSYRELLLHYPKRYEDRRTLPHFAALASQESATVAATVTGAKAIQSRKGLQILRVFLEDNYGARLTAVFFNQPWLQKRFYPQQQVVMTGKVKQNRGQKELHVTDYEWQEKGDSLSFGRIAPVYTSTQGLSQSYIRQAMHTLLVALPTIPDHLPKKLLQQHQLIPLNQALRYIHFPDNAHEAQQALRRLKFDEFLFLELRVLLNRDTSTLGKVSRTLPDAAKRFEESLPFTMTGAQTRVLKEIYEDMAQPKQMARLVQGDVGSGKTAVAAAAMYMATVNGYQAALMAPTEILARQHYANLSHYLYPLGVTCDLLVGSLPKSQADAVRAGIASGQVQVMVGTQALIQESVTFHHLGLAVIDEEHRFGVEQRRQLLRDKPDVLVMSATPIPRSLALTQYGDLELSLIDELPPGRKDITTRLVNDKKRRDVYRFAWGEIQKGRQVYVVTALIEESEAEGMTEIASAEQTVAMLEGIMPADCRLDILHGKMPSQEKDEVMARFREQKFDLLVATTVIEVGVDVPNATVMIIENAERFGLSQLHQLRGRVGRGEHQSFCILIAGDRSKKTQERLEVIEKYSDGFIIAEKDLQLRGPGEVRGTRQSGMPDLILGDLQQDGDIIEKTRDLAKKMLEADPKLEATWAERIRLELQRRVADIGFREVI